MEDVWNELSLSLTSLDHHYPTTAAAAGPPAAGLSLQEFLATPLNKPESRKKKPVVAKPLASADHHHKTPFCPPNSGVNFCACSKRKRVPSVDCNGNDLKYKLMKNRESAARSRARKQAYTSELEEELEHLMAENSKLRKQQEQLSAAAAAIGDQQQKKPKLQRTLTAPF